MYEILDYTEYDKETKIIFTNVMPYYNYPDEYNNFVYKFE